MNHKDGTSALCCYCGAPAFALLEVAGFDRPQAYCATCALVMLSQAVGEAIIQKTPDLLADDLPGPDLPALDLPDFPAMHEHQHAAAPGAWCRCAGRGWTILEVKDHKHAIVSACPTCNPEGKGT